uniref:Ionotropic glutamate receptor L-glutamate and glycine-binding domain-containing protein n=1 Tax=Anopheles atroparvus TaxID=41427 RepID=A0AAG5DNK1_ANOAO
MILWPLVVFCAVWEMPSTQAALEPAEATAATLLPTVVSDILLHYFRHSFQPLQIYQSSRTGEQGDVVGAVVRLLRGQCAVSLGPVPDGATARTRNVLFLDDLAALWQILAEFSSGRNDYSGRYLLVVTGDIDSDTADLPGVFEELWERNIVDVNVLVRCQDATVLVYTYRPYSPSHCGSPSVERVACFDGASRNVRVVNLYPRHRITSFHNCPLQVGTFEVRPYTIFDRKADGSIEVGGFEGDLLQLLAQRLQFRINVTLPPNRMEWGVVGPKGNSTGVMRLLQDGKVDFVIACMAMDVTRNLYLKPGIAHLSSRVVFSVPPGRPYSAFEKLFRPFRRNIWVGLSVYLAGVLLTVGGLSCASPPVRAFVYGDGVRMPLLNALYLLFGGSVLPVPVRNFPRTLFILWLLFTFVIRTVYQGSLYLYLQRSATYPPLATLDEVYRSTLEYHMVSIAMRFFVDKPEIGPRVHFIPPGLNSLASMVAGMSDRYDDRVVLCPLDIVAYHNRFRKRTLGGKPIHVTRDSITRFPVTIYYQPKSLLTNVFDREVRKLDQSGLMHFWVRNYGDYDFQTRLEGGGGDPKKLTNSHLAGAYQIFVVALLLSVLVFVVELVSVRVRSLRIVLDFCIR